MKTLFIMRHAKSSWENAGSSDFDRPLNERGLKAAPMMGKVMKKNKFQLDLILSSPAKRAEQTAGLVREATGIESEINFDERIYEASPARLLEVVAEQNDNVDSILLVGHNPGLEGLVRFLTGETHQLTTANLAVVDLQSNKWNELSSSSGNLRILIRPKDLQ
ncbi:MAG TPA: histidine phosphatase family protein [Pyrinomonadaceae bacterium]|nr:histidine phosphatase family protein [Pyrinomonadaceae bacterium]